MSHLAAASASETAVRTVVTVVHAPACHLCEQAQTVLLLLTQRYSLLVDRVDIRSERGRSLVRAHRPPMSPLVLIDGAFFSSGRLPRRKLLTLLDAREAAMHVTAADHGGPGN